MEHEAPHGEREWAQKIVNNPFQESKHLSPHRRPRGAPHQRRSVIPPGPCDHAVGVLHVAPRDAAEKTRGEEGEEGEGCDERGAASKDRDELFNRLMG